MLRTALITLVAMQALAGCGGDGAREPTTSDEARLVRLHYVLASTTIGCVNGELPDDDGCERRLEQGTRELLDALEGFTDRSRREHIGHALRTLANQCDRCERMLTDAGQGLAELGEVLVRDHDQRAS